MKQHTPYIFLLLIKKITSLIFVFPCQSLISQKFEIIKLDDAYLYDINWYTIIYTQQCDITFLKLTFNLSATELRKNWLQDCSRVLCSLRHSKVFSHYLYFYYFLYINLLIYYFVQILNSLFETAFFGAFRESQPNFGFGRCDVIMNFKIFRFPWSVYFRIFSIRIKFC